MQTTAGRFGGRRIPVNRVVQPYEVLGGFADLRGCSGRRRRHMGGLTLRFSMNAIIGMAQLALQTALALVISPAKTKCQGRR
jgi:hypothetical protein